MNDLLWLTIAYGGGIAAILGSLMLLGSLLLWLIPDDRLAPNRSDLWRDRLKLTAVALLLSISGFALLIAVPFPR